MGVVGVSIASILALVAKERLQYLSFLLLALFAIGLTLLASSLGRSPFQRFIGGIDPTFVMVATALLGAILLTLLLCKGWLPILSSGTARGVLLSAPFAIVLALSAIALDRKINFPADMNVLFPVSLAFYPAIGFLVEVALHVLPLALLIDQRQLVFPSTTIGIPVSAGG
jgi:hypothetical protein